ncbi:hypothetical protein FJQ54_09830 [Sandaracinobacter neustonicus]|uniref:TraB/GumN family protein n=1 Tax=Sandaracinobacter neustonicus TaxID=1715348 RepID=A0A501XKI3_9SPHN|nr:DUF5694 domain-containing protein [Sandaracinobacter neustonicus]TPE61181.1 hypothetical protein FJQ54_09830 [Sandaracinobacter neustonicus]
MRLTFLAALLGSLAFLPAHAAGFDPREHRAPLAGESTQVMVLGTPHLSGLPKDFQPQTLSLLLDRLAGWKPDAIAIEGVSGLQCEQYRQNPAIWPGVADAYCVDLAAAAKASGMTVPAATAEAARLLAAWPATPTASQRRHLALSFLAAGEPASAVVQWLRLPPAERIAQDGLTPELVEWLDARINRRNENYLIAAALAARLGHERVWSTDDHSADSLTAADDPDFEKAMQRIWSGPESDARSAAAKAINAQMQTQQAVLKAYRYYNDPAEADRAFATDFGKAMADATPQNYGRRYLGWWETRNLRMAGNVREVAALKPGGRVLVLTGASHKGYLDAYLGMMHDVKIADPLPLLQ